MPWVAWAAPRTVRTDMRGPGLSALALDILTSSSGQTRVLAPSGANGTQLVVSPEAKRRGVDFLVGR